jgi:predicted metalloprotease with PDZ domain
LLYQTYYKQKKRGFTEEEFADALKIVTGTSFTDLLQQIIYTTNPIDYSKYLNYVGLELKNEPSKKLPLGVTVKVENGKTIIKSVELNKAASEAGLSVNDEIIAINGYRVNADLDEFTSRFKQGEAVSILVSRMGKLLTLELVPQVDKTLNYKLTKLNNQDETQKAFYDFWIK